MITVNRFQVSPDMSELRVKVTSAAGSPLNGFFLQTDETYLDSSIDLTSKFTYVSDTEEFVVTAEELNITSFNGIYFGKFTSVIDPEVNVAACNFTQFFYPINDQLSIVDPGCISCDDKLDNALLMDLYLEGLKAALISEKYTNAITNLYSLRRLCVGRIDNCVSGCTSGYGILDGAFVLA